MKELVIIGGTGFIGRHLVKTLQPDYRIVVLSRHPERHQGMFSEGVDLKKYDLNDPSASIPLFDGVHGVINLSGENIGGGRWTETFKDRVMKSRLEVGNFLKVVFNALSGKPNFLLQASATGIYGNAPSDEEMTESSPSARDSFLTEVAFKNEENLAPVKAQTRLVFLRTGIVLDAKEGALPRIALPFKLFVGGRIGNGRQWMPWIHLDDVVHAIRHIIDNDRLAGPVNLTSPESVRQKDFARSLAKALHRPCWLPAPAFALKLILGSERASDLLLTGRKVVPEKLVESGFSFHHREIDEAFQNIYNPG
jgi:uncharacterized protein (TIGR01777 family)